MELITYQNIVPVILKNFPEFKDYDLDYLDIQHVIIGKFAQFLINKIENFPDDKVIPKSFKFINDIFTNSSDYKLLDLIRIELFENLVQSKKVIEVSQIYLHGNAISSFKIVMEEFGV